MTFNEADIVMAEQPDRPYARAGSRPLIAVSQPLCDRSTKQKAPKANQPADEAVTTWAARGD